MTFAALLSEGGSAFEAPRSLYLHIPVCSSRCAYCDFHSFPRAALSDDFVKNYVESLLERAEDLCAASGAPVETMYVGGGTPSALEDTVFSRLIGGLAERFRPAPSEWTVEVNPETLTQRKMDIMRDKGVTRISMGIQSMDGGELSLLGRRAGAADNRRAIDIALASGLAVSADLIGALPRALGAAKRKARGPWAARGALLDSARYLADKGLEHISVYDLCVEEGTELSRRMERGELEPADEDVAWEERKALEGFLKTRGYRRYEVSNYAVPGNECRHNGAYWAMRSYLGVGSGAVSTLIVADEPRARLIGAGGALSLRITEGRDLAGFMAAPDKAMSLSWLGAKDSAFEMLMMGLRSAAGLDEARFRRRFGFSAPELLPNTLKKWNERFSRAMGRLCLDDHGLDVLNRILVDALEEMEAAFPAAGIA